METSVLSMDIIADAFACSVGTRGDGANASDRRIFRLGVHGRGKLSGAADAYAWAPSERYSRKPRPCPCSGRSFPYLKRVFLPAPFATHALVSDGTIAAHRSSARAAVPRTPQFRTPQFRAPLGRNC